MGWKAIYRRLLNAAIAGALPIWITGMVLGAGVVKLTPSAEDVTNKLSLGSLAWKAINRRVFSWSTGNVAIAGALPIWIPGYPVAGGVNDTGPASLLTIFWLPWLLAAGLAASTTLCGPECGV
jgi:hypothetical protein